MHQKRALVQSLNDAVEGESDDARFSKLFQLHMRRWQRLALQLECHEKKLADERSIVRDLLKKV